MCLGVIERVYVCVRVFVKCQMVWSQFTYYVTFLEGVGCPDHDDLDYARVGGVSRIIRKLIL